MNTCIQCTQHIKDGTRDKLGPIRKKFPYCYFSLNSARPDNVKPISPAMFAILPSMPVSDTNFDCFKLRIFNPTLNKKARKKTKSSEYIFNSQTQHQIVRQAISLYKSEPSNTVELQRLEQCWNNENMFETGEVRANEC